MKIKNTLAIAITSLCIGIHPVLAQEKWDKTDQPIVIEHYADNSRSIEFLDNKPNPTKAKIVNSRLSDKLIFSGLLEVEASYAKGYANVSTSDVVLATVELSSIATINENMSMSATLLYEEDDTPLDIDSVTIDYNQKGFSVIAGKTYLPFGVFETNMVNDTLVLELTEVSETALIIGYQRGILIGRTYVFNGDVDTGNDTLNDFGIHLGLYFDQFTVGVDYISNFLDSDNVSSTLEDKDVANLIEEDVSGVVINAMYDVGPVSFIVEMFQAEEFEASDSGGFIAKDITVKAFQFEIATHFNHWTLAASYQKTNDALLFELPDERISISGSAEMIPSLNAVIELWKDKDYRRRDGGSEESSIGLLLQVATSF